MLTNEAVAPALHFGKGFSAICDAAPEHTVMAAGELNIRGT